MSTATAFDWVKAIISAPDATYQMAQAHFNPGSQVLTVRNRVSTTVATYTLTSHDLNGDVLNGVTDDGGDISVKPDERCTCIGFKKRDR